MIKKEKILEIQGIDIEFGERRKKFKAVKNVSFDIYKGENFGLVGESGSGKTSIGRAIIRLNQISSGYIKFQDEIISGRINKEVGHEIKKNIQMIFQDPISSLNERAKISYIVSEGLYNANRKITPFEINKKVNKALLDVGLLPEHADRFPHEFSGGQRQRIGIARAIIMEPKLIIADEPLSALDASIRAKVTDLLMDLQRKRGLTYLFISHDLAVVRNLCNRIGVLYRGQIVEMGDAKKVFKNPQHPYTKMLISSILIPDPIKERKRKLNLFDHENMGYHELNDKNKILLEIEPNHFILTNRNQ